MEIQYIDRETGKLEKELVYGDKAVKWLYDSFIGRLLASLVTSRFFSRIYGRFQDMGFSARKIGPFIQKFKLDMNEFEPGEDAPEGQSYSNFNDFFIRRFKEGKRPFDSDPATLPAFCESRYFGHSSISDDVSIPVKGRFLSSKLLLLDERWSLVFNKGPLLVARLCPVDYHRFHFPDNAKVIDHYTLHGKYHSVNPLALRKHQDIFIQNERQVTILDTENFGKLAYVEVGATCVGRIVQSYKGRLVKRGQEKGYFLFGGSTVIVMGEKGVWSPSKDILENTNNGHETYIKLGQPVGHRL